MTTKETEKLRSEAVAVIDPVVSTASRSTIADTAGYGLADAFLKKIRAARKQIEDKLGPIIDPIRRGLDELYALKRELDRPLDAAEADIKSKMKAWQVAETRRIADEEAAKRREEARLRELAEAKAREEERLRREAEEAQRRADMARTRAAREKLEAEAAELRRQAEAEAAKGRKLDLRAETVATTPIEAATKGASSAVRKVKKWRVVDFDLLVAAVAKGKVPTEVLTTNDVAINAVFRDDPDAVAAWPGIETYDDVVIAGRK